MYVQSSEDQSSNVLWKKTINAYGCMMMQQKNCNGNHYMANIARPYIKMSSFRQFYLGRIRKRISREPSIES